MRCCITIASVAFMSFGCGTAVSVSTTRGAVAPAHILVAMMGGNGSCAKDAAGLSSPYGMVEYAPFARLSQQITAKDGTIVDFFLSCFDDGSNLHYYASDQPQSLVNAQVQDVPSKLQQLAGQDSAAKVYIAGHSYGGWLALKTALALPMSITLSGLFSIDPISKVNCTQSSPIDCTEAPTDIAQTQYQTLRDRAEDWVNFYQTTTGQLHSSPISLADSNIFVPNTDHPAMATAQPVWDVLTQRITGP